MTFGRSKTRRPNLAQLSAQFAALFTDTPPSSQAGAVFIREAHVLLRRAKSPQNRTLASLRPMRLFHFSISYLTIVFVAVAVDPLLYLPLPF